MDEHVLIRGPPLRLPPSTFGWHSFIHNELSRFVVYVRHKNTGTLEGFDMGLPNWVAMSDPGTDLSFVPSQDIVRFCPSDHLCESNRWIAISIPAGQASIVR